MFDVFAICALSLFLADCIVKRFTPLPVTRKLDIW
jgi:hypothetical protein